MMFDGVAQLALGLVSGAVFGFLLQKGRAAKYEVIVGQFLLRDWTVVKIMATAVVVGAIGVNLLVAHGHAALHVKPLVLGPVVLGGVLFGVGLVVFGLCPGTSVAALGEGRRDACAGVAGMFTGALLFVLAAPLTAALRSGDGFGKVTLPGFTGTSAETWALGLALLAVVAVLLRIARPARGP